MWTLLLFDYKLRGVEKENTAVYGLLETLTKAKAVLRFKQSTPNSDFFQPLYVNNLTQNFNST